MADKPIINPKDGTFYHEPKPEDQEDQNDFDPEEVEDDNPDETEAEIKALEEKMKKEEGEVSPPRNKGHKNQKKVELLPHQIDHFDRVGKILEENHGYFDTSLTRCGKTIIVMALAQLFSFRIFVVCPVSAESGWKEEAKKFGVEIVHISTYASFRSVTGKQPKHGYLNRHDDKTKKVTKTSFSLTTKAKELFEQGVLLIFDEFHHIKNNSAQYKACAAFVDGIQDYPLCRFGLLSATPFDKEEHALQIVRFLGYVKSVKMFQTNPHTGVFELAGAQELIDRCALFDENATKKICEQVGTHHKNRVSELVFTLFSKVIKNAIGSAMEKPEYLVHKDVSNGYYNLPKDAEIRIMKAVNGFAAAANYDDETQTVERPEKNNFGAITLSMKAIEKEKIPLFIRLTDATLQENPKAKVVLFVHYTHTFEALRDALEHWGLVAFNGSSKKEDRAARVKMFQEDPEIRVLVTNAKVGSEGISLDDQKGDEPRFSYVSPSYDMTVLHQLSGRTFTPTTKSNATVRMVYCKAGSIEMRILNALAIKTKVVKNVLDDRIRDAVLFPGEYPDYHEE